MSDKPPASKGIGMNAKSGAAGYDAALYSADDKSAFLDYIPDEATEQADLSLPRKNQRLAGITGQSALIEEMKMSGPHEDPMKDFGHKKIVEREDQYHQRRLNRGALSPERVDPFAKPTSIGASTKPGVKRTYYDIMTEQSLNNEKADVLRKIDKKEEEKRSLPPPPPPQKRSRFDDTASTANVTIKNLQPSEWDKHEVGDIKQAVKESSRISTKWDTPKRTPAMDGLTPSRRNRWDLTPQGAGGVNTSGTTPSRFSQVQMGGETPTPGRWSQPTPMRMMSETPTPGTSRFGETPVAGAGTRWDQKPGMTPQNGFMQTPQQGYNPMMTPTPGSGMIGQSLPYWQKDLYDRNKPLTDEELDQMIPTAGYEIFIFAFL
ncbi:hypothetical protein FGO68_gene3837 [Halteria grandinella]|uniref:Splicing factor 3B subunit 1 domain-containing protein n=1 Tax=Halteria grandinella TaxID=5974 RepID=A0A8J8SW96_HALGN|nr:hypothetical protein FGO68_gene3837 [Halteria grandinella]